MQFQPHNHTTHNPPTPNFYSPNGVACAPEFLDRHTTCSGPNSRRGVLSQRTTEGHSHKGRNGNVGWMWARVGGVGLGWDGCRAWLVHVTHVALDGLHSTFHCGWLSTWLSPAPLLPTPIDWVSCILLLLLSSVCPRSCCCWLSQCLRPYRVGFISW